MKTLNLTPDALRRVLTLANAAADYAERNQA